MLDFFRNIFGKKNNKPSVDSAVTAPLSDVQLKSIVTTTAQNRFEPTQFLVASGQSVGRQRELNEDSIFTFATVIAGNSSNPPLGLFIIADGMGGHQYGEIASNTAIRSISGYVMKKFHNSLFTIPTQPVDESLQEIIQAGIMEAQRAVLREAPGSGTTVTAALVLGQQLTIAHVGDSRAYLLRANQIYPITRDHSMVRQMVDAGMLTEIEAMRHPDANQITRALGMTPTVEVELRPAPMPAHFGDLVLLASDGLTDLVLPHEIASVVLQSKAARGLEFACQQLVALANSRGGHDNITVLLGEVREARDARPASPTVPGSPEGFSELSSSTLPDVRSIAQALPPSQNPSATGSAPTIVDLDGGFAPGASLPGSSSLPAVQFPPMAFGNVPLDDDLDDDRSRRKTTWLSVGVALVLLGVALVFASLWWALSASASLGSPNLHVASGSHRAGDDLNVALCLAGCTAAGHSRMERFNL